METSALGKYVKKFEEQEPRETKQIEVARSPIVDEICRRYELWLDWIIEPDDWKNAYKLSTGLLKGNTYTPKDVRDFSLSLKQYESRKDFNQTGIFLSGLVDLSDGEDFELVTELLDEPIDFIGYKNRKNLIVQGNAGAGVGVNMHNGSITIQGNAGQYVGSHMQNGSITIQGNAGDNVGREMKNGSINVKGNAGNDVGNCMQDGSITTQGNAGQYVGSHMQNGSITIQGNAEHWVGDNMQDGIIRIEGSIGSLSIRWYGGKIYHKRRLVRDKE